jgi:site-specific DNA recombinase
VPAIPLEELVVEAVRAEAQPDTEPKGDLSDRVLIDRYIGRIIVRPDSIDIELREPTVVPAPLPATNAPVAADVPASSTCTTVISLPWSVPAFSSVKGVLYHADAKPTLKPETRDAILLATAKARSWIDDLVSGRVQSFDEIAEREGKVERHIRLLTPLALIPPRTLAAIIDRTTSTATWLTRLRSQ